MHTAQYFPSINFPAMHYQDRKFLKPPNPMANRNLNPSLEMFVQVKYLVRIQFSYSNDATKDAFWMADRALSKLYGLSISSGLFRIEIY